MLSKKIKFLKYKNRNFSINSKEVKKNDIFFAIEGSKQSGVLYSSEALSKGAFKVVTSKNIKNKNYLFEKDDKNIWSNSALERLGKRMEKSEKCKQAINKRWRNKDLTINTNVLQTNNVCNTSKSKSKSKNLGF